MQTGRENSPGETECQRQLDGVRAISENQVKIYELNLTLGIFVAVFYQVTTACSIFANTEVYASCAYVTSHT